MRIKSGKNISRFRLKIKTQSNLNFCVHDDILFGTVYEPSDQCDYRFKKLVIIERVLLIGDGRSIVGLLKGFDQLVNIVLEDSHERVYSEAAGVDKIPLGLYIIRGDNV